MYKINIYVVSNNIVKKYYKGLSKVLSQSENIFSRVIYCAIFNLFRLYRSPADNSEN